MLRAAIWNVLQRRISWKFNFNVRKSRGISSLRPFDRRVSFVDHVPRVLSGNDNRRIFVLFSTDVSVSLSSSFDECGYSRLIIWPSRWIETGVLI